MSDVVGLLDVAAGDPRSPAWGQLYEAVCHQGTCYPDGFVPLPRLAEIAATFAPQDRDQVVGFAGDLAADADVEEHARDQAALMALRRAAQECLATPTDADTFVYRLQAILALEGDHRWGKNLCQLNEQEFEVSCPSCEDDLFIVLGDDGFFACCGDYAVDDDVERSELVPADVPHMDDLGRRLYEASIAAGQHSVATALTYAFGQATCPLCAATFKVADRVD